MRSHMHDARFSSMDLHLDGVRMLAHDCVGSDNLSGSVGCVQVWIAPGRPCSERV